MALKPLANRKNAVGPNQGNADVRFKDSTAKVAGEIMGGMRPPMSGKRHANGGCSDCNK